MLKVQQAAKYVPIEAIRMVQTDVIAIQAEAIHQTGKQKSTSKKRGKYSSPRCRTCGKPYKEEKWKQFNELPAPSLDNKIRERIT